MRVLFVHTEQYTDWQIGPLSIYVRQPIVTCGAALTVHDFVRNHRQKPIDLEAEGRALLDEVEKFKPDLIVYSNSWYDVPNAYLSEIRRRGVPVLSILWDTWVDTNANELNLAQHSDYVAVCDSVSNYLRYRLLFDLFRARRSGVLFIGGFMVTSDMFKERPQPKIYDAAVLGSAEGVRASLIDYLQANLPGHIRFSKLGGLVNSSVGSHELGLTDGWIPQDKYVDAINQTKVLISSQTRPERVQIKSKCGGFCLIDRNSEHERLIPEGCVAYFDSPEDLARKVVYYVENNSERETIAKRGQMWFRMTFDHRPFWQAFFDYVAGNAQRLPSLSSLEVEYNTRIGSQALKGQIRTGVMQVLLNIIPK